MSSSDEQYWSPVNGGEVYAGLAVAIVRLCHSRKVGLQLLPEFGPSGVQDHFEHFAFAVAEVGPVGAEQTGQDDCLPRGIQRYVLLQIIAAVSLQLLHGIP